MKHLSKTGVEYGTHAYNFYPGCKHGLDVCPVSPRCWAEGMSRRQREDFHKPHLLPERLLAPLSLKKPARILVNFMGDLFGDWVDPDMVIAHKEADFWIASKDRLFGIADETIESGSLREIVFHVCRVCPHHAFIFLTKAPWNLAKWSPFPDNCQVGVSACNYKMALAGARSLGKIEARVKWLSYEPFYDQVFDEKYAQDPALSPTTLVVNSINWIVIGAQTNPYLAPSAEAVDSIIRNADKAGAKVFLKDNLANALPPSKPFYDDEGNYRQEYPL